MRVVITLLKNNNDTSKSVGGGLGKITNEKTLVRLEENFKVFFVYLHTRISFSFFLSFFLILSTECRTEDT